MIWTSWEQSFHSVTLCKLDLKLYSFLMLFLDCAWIVSVLFLICLLSVFSSVYRRDWHCIPYCADVSLRNYSLTLACACVKVNAGQREHISSTNNMHQNSVFESCLDKKFFFFPGIKRTHWEEVYSCMLVFAAQQKCWSVVHSHVDIVLYMQEMWYIVTTVTLHLVSLCVVLCNYTHLY